MCTMSSTCPSTVLHILTHTPALACMRYKNLCYQQSSRSRAFMSLPQTHWQDRWACPVARRALPSEKHFWRQRVWLPDLKQEAWQWGPPCDGQREALTDFHFSQALRVRLQKRLQRVTFQALTTGSHQCFPKESELARQLKWLRFGLANTIFMI